VQPTIPGTRPTGGTGPRSPSRGRWIRYIGAGALTAALVLLAIFWGFSLGPFAPSAEQSPGNGGAHGGPWIGLGTFSEESSGMGTGEQWYYNATVQDANGGIAWSNIVFQVQMPSGDALATGPTAVTTTNSTQSCETASYEFSTATWSVPNAHSCVGVSTGGKATISTGDQLRLTSSVSLQDLGYQLVALGEGSFAGSASFAIP
jgi:hypothetical protein